MGLLDIYSPSPSIIGAGQPTGHQPTGAQPASGGDSGSSWMSFLPGLIGGAASGIFGGGAGLASFASAYADGRYRQKKEEDEKNFRTETALADQAHKTWQELSDLDLSNVGGPDAPPELANIKERLDAINQKYIQSLSPDSPGGARRTSKESQELIALSTTFRNLLPQINRANEDAQFTHQADLKQQAADKPFIQGREEQLLADAGVDRSDLGMQSLPEGELTKIATSQFGADRAAAQQRQLTGVQSPEAFQQDIDKAVQQAERLKAIPPPPVSLIEPSAKYLGLGGAGNYSPADIDVMKQKREEEARVRAAAAGRAQYGGNSGRLDPSDPATKTFVSNLADRYARREITWKEAQASMGGVHSGLGPLFESEVGNRMGLDSKSKNLLTSIQVSRSTLDDMEGLINEVVSAPDAQTQIEKSYLLDAFIKSKAGTVARGFSSETGVITNPDIERALAIVPGWKAANFNPDFAKQMLNTMRSNMAGQENALLRGSASSVELDANGRPSLAITPPPVAGTAPASRASALDAFRKKHGLR